MRTLIQMSVRMSMIKFVHIPKEVVVEYIISKIRMGRMAIFL